MTQFIEFLGRRKLPCWWIMYNDKAYNVVNRDKPHLRHTLDVQCSNYQLAFDKYTEAASLTQRCIWINNSTCSRLRIRYIWSLPELRLFCEQRECVCYLFAMPLDNSRTNDRMCSFNAAAASGDKFASTHGVRHTGCSFATPAMMNRSWLRLQPMMAAISWLSEIEWALN